MALDKAIEHNKEYRKKYRHAKAIDPMCRNYGGCDWCLENRTYKFKKKEIKISQELEEYKNK